MTKLFEFILSIGPVSEGLKEELHQNLKARTYKKKTLLLREGEVCREIHFIESGLARAFYYNNEKQFTSWFMGEGDMIISVHSFYTQQPAYEYIELLEDSTLISLNYKTLQRLYLNYPEFNFIGRVLTERYYALSEDRSRTLRTLSAQDRYRHLMETFPSIFNRAPIKYIASYLGMSRETLSRMRSGVKHNSVI